MFSLAAGVDAIEIERVRHVLDRHGQRFLNRIYSELEVAYCRGRVPELAVRFAGKEAVMKALGTGVRGISWREIELLPDRRGKPLVYLNGKASARAAAFGLGQMEVSLSHSDTLALAFVVAPNFGEAIDLEDSRRSLIDRLQRRGLL